MSELGATLARTGDADTRILASANHDIHYRARFRRPIVAATLVTGDIVAAALAIWTASALVVLAGLAQPAPEYFRIALLILVFYSLRLYNGSGPSPYERFRMRTIGIVGFAAISLLIHFSEIRTSSYWISVALEALTLLVIGHYIEGASRALLIRLKLWGASTALVGCTDASCKLVQLLDRQPELGLMPIGIIATNHEQSPKRAPLPLIGQIDNLDNIPPDIEAIAFSSGLDLSTVELSRTWMPSCQILLVEDVDNTQSLWLRTRMLGGAIGIEMRHDLCLRHKQWLKRIIDVLLAVPMVAIAAPIIGFLALVVRIVDPGPAFYVQSRVGSNGQTLRMYKLRTMYADAEQRLDAHLNQHPEARAEWERFFKLSHDPRVLPIIGRLMRRTSLDELPQLWNVICGEMSLVGPRPFPVYHMNSFDETFRSIRATVKPGITGMWQVSSRSDGDLQVQKTQDLFYIRNWSLWLDIYILMQTVPAVLRAKGAK